MALVRCCGCGAGSAISTTATTAVRDAYGTSQRLAFALSGKAKNFTAFSACRISCILGGGQNSGLKVPRLGVVPLGAESGVSGHGIRRWNAKFSTEVHAKRGPVPKKEVEISVPVMVEESFEAGSDIQDLVRQLEQDAIIAVKMGIEGFKPAEKADTVELSVVICNDAYIRQLNKQWLGKDSATDVLSFPQDGDQSFSPLLLLGDVVISVETAKQQAEERKHSILDEMRILLVHGLLHVLGYDHELGPDHQRKMEAREQQILENLGWKGKGLIYETYKDDKFEGRSYNGDKKGRQQKRTPFKVLFCDMDGTLINSKGYITKATANALRATMDLGVQVIVATGKTRPAAMAALRPVGLEGQNGVLSNVSAGVFVQGLLVYGQDGTLLHRRLLSKDLCLEACTYSRDNNIPIIGFCPDRTVTVFDHPFAHTLHVEYLEPKAEVLKSLNDVHKLPIQKILFYEKQERIDEHLKPYWSSATNGEVTLVQALPDMLEMLPPGGSKGAGVKMLLDHLNIHPDEVMAIGDGDNDIEMLEMVGWGVAMGNASRGALGVADAKVGSNNEDGVVEAIERFILP